MDLLQNLSLGFGVAFTFQNLLYAFMGCVLGTLIGVLPGLGPVATIAMLLPSIYSLDATPALIMLAGIYYGAQYGGSTTAILINVPGESSSVVTAIDGYQMARQPSTATRWHGRDAPDRHSRRQASGPSSQDAWARW
jgi:putative tricarboxylic transport membrane protein